MQLDRDAITAAIENARSGERTYCDLDGVSQCEFYAEGNDLRFILSLPRRAHQVNQLVHLTHKRHSYPDQYGDISLGTDGEMNLYAGKTIAFISPIHAINEIQNVCEFFRV